MTPCSPAADVYGGQPDPFHACLPMTGAPLLTPVLLALLLLSLGLMLRGGLMVLYARQHAEEAARARYHGDNPLIERRDER